MAQHIPQTEYTFPASRLATFDTGKITAGKNLMQAMLEVTDGAPATRFIHRLVEMLETGAEI